MAKSSLEISAEPVWGQKIEEQVVTDFDAHNDENRSSVTSSAVAEERQDVSSKNAIDEMVDAITGDNDRSLCPLACQYTGMNVVRLVQIWNRFFLTLWWKVIFKTWCFTTQKEKNLWRKCTTSLIRRQNYNGEVVDRSWLCFLSTQTCVKCFTCRLMCPMRLNVRSSLLEKESSTGSKLLSAWGATSI